MNESKGGNEKLEPNLKLTWIRGGLFSGLASLNRTVFCEMKGRVYLTVVLDRE